MPAVKNNDIPKTTHLFIKNMVCPRCIKVIRDEFTGLGLDIRSINLGEVVVSGNISSDEMNRVQKVLEENGFELLEDKRARLIEQIKLEIIQMVNEDHTEGRESLTARLKKAVNQDYVYISTLFSSVENITIEQFYILQKIEKVKELLKYNELSLSEIAWRLGYSSVQHLSSQFRKVTGLTPTQFKSAGKRSGAGGHHDHTS